MGQHGEIEAPGRLAMKSRGAIFALDRFKERQFLVALEADREIAKISAEPHSQPGRQCIQIGAPAFGRIENGPLSNPSIDVHGLYCICFTVEGETLILGEKPTGCAARLPVEPYRQVERLDQIGHIQTDAIRRLVAAQRIAQLVVAGA